MIQKLLKFSIASLIGAIGFVWSINVFLYFFETLFSWA